VLLLASIGLKTCMNVPQFLFKKKLKIALNHHVLQR